MDLGIGRDICGLWRNGNGSQLVGCNGLISVVVAG